MRSTTIIGLQMKFDHDWLRVFGDKSYRGDCPKEVVEQVTFFNRLRREYPDSWGRIALHPRNEGLKTYAQVAREKAEGMAEGASDIVIPGSPAFVCEIKRKDHTRSKWEKCQLDYLEAAYRCGAFVCVALGADGATEAFNQYLKEVKK